MEARRSGRSGRRHSWTPLPAGIRGACGDCDLSVEWVGGGGNKKSAAAGGRAEQGGGVAARRRRRGNLCLSYEDLVMEQDGSDPPRGNLGAAAGASLQEGMVVGCAEQRAPRVRHTFLQDDVDWAACDALELSWADRRADAERVYERPVVDAEKVKKRWQAKQVKFVSKAAEMFGARESQRALWEFIIERDPGRADNTGAEPQEGGRRSQESAVSSKNLGPGSDEHSQLHGDAKRGSRRKSSQASRTDKEQGEESAESGAATVRRGVKSKSIFGAFKGLFYQQPEPQAAFAHLVRRMERAAQKNPDAQGAATV